MDPLPTLDSESTLLLVFADANLYESDEFQNLLQAFPKSKMLGCSTAGQISGNSLADDGISVLAIQFEKTSLKLVFAPVGSGRCKESGAKLGGDLLGKDLRAVITLTNGLDVNGSKFVRGLNSILPTEVVVTGALAGDGFDFRRTWVMDAQGEPQTDIAAAVGLYGDSVQIWHGSEGGWRTFGVRRKVTRSKGNVLYELDGRPALKIYKEVLQELAANLPSSALLYPLSLLDITGEKTLIRTVLAVNDADHSLTFAGDIPEGAEVQMMKATVDSLIEGARLAAQGASSELDKAKETAAIVISCVGRRMVLGDRVDEELDAVHGVLPNGTCQAGLYSYGEIVPVEPGVACDLHNQTMTLTVLQEK